MPKADKSGEDSGDAWKKEIEESIKRLSASTETGLRSITEEMRTLEYQVQSIADSFGKMEYMLQQQVQQSKQGEPIRSSKTGKVDTNIGDFKEITNTLSKLVKNIDETIASKFFELRNLINDVELNILSTQKKLILESKIKLKEKEM